MNRTRLILVDDEPAFLGALQKRLIKRGIDVVSAAGGKEALEALHQDPTIEVVILDVKMPGMDGIATLKELKRVNPAVQAILLTGHATFESAVQGMKQGAFDCMSKPCDLEELLNRVQEAMAKRRVSRNRILPDEREMIIRRGGT